MEQEPCKSNIRRRCFRITVTFVAFALLFFTVQRLLMPKYASVALEGNLIHEYYSSAKDHDVIFIGDCEVYANFSPITLWEEYGITSYIRGSPQQLIWQSYYLLEDVLRNEREKPKVVVFNVLAMQYNKPQYEPYNRLTLDGMRWSPAKFKAIAASKTDDDDWLSYFLPLFRYKDNWRELGKEDFKYFFQSPRVSINGFIIRSDTVPVDYIPDPLRLPNYEFGDNAFDYLERITQLTRDNGIELILVKAPSLYPHWHKQWDEQIMSFAEKNNLLYINFLEYIDDIGLDFATDTFNAGLHLNVFGAERLTRYFGKILQDQYALPDHRAQPETAARWDEMATLYHNLVKQQLEEIAQTGKIESFLIE